MLGSPLRRRRPGPEPAIIGHTAILAAVARHAPDEAEAAMLDHLGWAEHDIRAAANFRSGP